MKSHFFTRLTMVFATILMFTFFASSQTTIKVRVNASHDDAEEILLEKHEPEAPFDTLPVGDVDLGSSDLELGTEVDGAPQLIGMIFRDVRIPVGATILNAYIQFHVDDDNDDSITNTIFGALEANIDSSFKDELFNISSHPRTVDTVAWTPPPWMFIHEEGPDQATPDISSIITEIISLDGWAPGNNLMLMITNPTLVKEHREAESFDGEPEGAPQLVVTFTFTPTTTIKVRVNASHDDAEEILLEKHEPEAPFDTLPVGDVDLGSSDLELGTEVDGAPQLIGMIFRDVQIPKGAVVRNAYIQFHVDDDNDDSITNTIFGALEANIDSSFKDELFNISTHPRTTDTVAWTPPPWMFIHEEGPDQATPDISSIINEIISLDGWAAGNSLMLMITNPTLVKEHREAESFDGEPDGAPQLVVEFDEIPKEIEVLIAGENDDAEEYIDPTFSDFGGMDTGSSDLELGRDGTTADGNGAQAVGVRYILPVGHGATISEAYLQFSADQASDGPLTLEIYAEAADNALAFTEDSADISSRAKTTAMVEWTPFDWETQHAAADSQKSVDISSLIQEVVSRYGFVKGNAIVIVLRPTILDDTIGFREAGAFSDDDGPPVLNLTYVGGAASANASLADLTIDVGTLDPGFDPATLEYTALLPPGTAAVTVSAEADIFATVVVEQAVIDALSGVATVVVTAEDGTALTYTITMTVSTVGVERVNPVSDISLYHNSLINQLTIFNTTEVEMLEIYSITGKLLNRMKIHNQESLDISTANLSHGVYLVRMKLSSNRIQTGKFVK